MNVDQATKLVRASLMKVSRESRDAGSRKQLKSLGISGMLLHTFKEVLVKALQACGVNLSARQLGFSETATVGQVSVLVAARTQGANSDKSVTVRRRTTPSEKSASAAAKRDGPKKSAAANIPVKKVVAKNQVVEEFVRGLGLPGPRRRLPPRLPKLTKPNFASNGGHGKIRVFGFVELDKDDELLLDDTVMSIRRETRPKTDVASATAGGEKWGSGSSEEHTSDGSETPAMLQDEVVEEAGSAADILPSSEPTACAARVLECTPQMEIVQQLEGGLLYALEVYLDQQTASVGAQVQKARFEYTEDLTEIPVEVWFDCSSQLMLEGVPANAKLTVNIAAGTSDRLEFKLRVLAGGDGGPMYVSAFFRFSGRPCGKITRFLDHTAKGARWVTLPEAVRTDGEVVLPRAATTPAVAVEVSSQPADIQVEVLKTEANDGQHFMLRCSDGRVFWLGEWNFPQMTRDIVNTYMQRFMAAKGKARIAALKAAGLAFWDALPTGARQLMWDAIDGGAQSISIVSEEPYIPWELMVPHLTLRNQRKPLGVELRVGRWITGDYTSPPQRIPMRSAYIVCPKTSGLTSSNQELNFMMSLTLDPAETIVPANFDGLDAGLSGPVRDIVHFICHGKSAAIQTLQLETPDTVDCSQVRAMDGFLKAFEHGGFAFLNACEVGGLVLALDGVGGFAHSFIELGASGVVAPLWPVQDAAALQVSQMFYGQALKGTALSEIMKQIRMRAYEEAIDSYAAYCFYGDPEARAITTQR